MSADKFLNMKQPNVVAKYADGDDDDDDEGQGGR